MVRVLSPVAVKTSSPVVQAFGLPVPDASWFEEQRPQPQEHAGTMNSSSEEEEELTAMMQNTERVRCFMTQPQPSSPGKTRRRHSLDNEQCQAATKNIELPQEHELSENSRSKKMKGSKSSTALSLKRSFRFSRKSFKKSLSASLLPKLSFHGKLPSASFHGKLSSASLHGLRKRLFISTSSTDKKCSSAKDQEGSQPESEEQPPVSPRSEESSNVPGRIEEYDLGMEEDQQDSRASDWNDTFHSQRSNHLPVHEEEEEDNESEAEAGKDEFHESETWFGEDTRQKEQQMIEEERIKADEAFYQKLKRAQGVPKSPKPVKRSPSEAYSAQNYDYGASRPALKKASSLRSIDKTLCMSQSFDDDSTLASSSVGIARPKPLQNNPKGNFILPTVVVGKSFFSGQQIQSPPPHQSLKSSSPTSVLASPNGAFSSPSPSYKSPVCGTQNQMRSISSSEGLCSPPGMPYMDDEASVGSNASGFTHYSRDSLASVNSRRSNSSTAFQRPKNVARMIHGSLDERMQSAEFGNSSPAVPAYVMALEQKVQDLETKLTALDNEDKRSGTQLKDPSLSSVFVLLLEPIQRKFELVQLSSYLMTDTVGDLLRQIYKHATVPLLADQTYRGFCRPKDGIEMALGETPMGKVPGGWRVVQGEILIGIPQKSCGKDCAAMAQPILQDHKVVQLLRRKNPLGETSRSKRHRRRSSAASPKNKLTGQVINDIDSEVQRSLARLLLGQSGRNLLAVNEE
jgi:hypothetical protein